MTAPIEGAYRRTLDQSGQRAWRKRLVAVMARQGFVNYAQEWWHFSLPGAGRQPMIFRFRRGARIDSDQP